MAKGKTLWEMLTGRWSTPVEFKFCNPLKARIGNAVMLNEVELRDLNFFIHEIREYRRTINGRQFLSADYVLLARPLHGADVLARLRLNPVADPDRAAGVTHDALLLRLYDETAYNEDLHNVVKDTTRKFQVLQDGRVQEEYHRVNDVTGSYRAHVSVIRDANKDGKVEMNEVAAVDVEYWDYWREATDEAGQPVTEFLFVEMNTSDGWFQLWRGRAIDPQKVLVM